MFSGSIYPSDQEDAKLKFERERKSVQKKKIKPDMMRASIYKEFSKGATEKEMLRICHISVFQSTKYG